jgi:hypothetical protein
VRFTISNLTTFTYTSTHGNASPVSACNVRTADFVSPAARRFVGFWGSTGNTQPCETKCLRAEYMDIV